MTQTSRKTSIDLLRVCVSGGGSAQKDPLGLLVNRVDETERKAFENEGRIEKLKNAHHIEKTAEKVGERMEENAKIIFSINIWLGVLKRRAVQHLTYRGRGPHNESQIRELSRGLDT